MKGKPPPSSLPPEPLPLGMPAKVEDLAICFKSRGRYRDSIKAHLEVLEDLGLVHRLEGTGLTRWHRPTVAVG